MRLYFLYTNRETNLEAALNDIKLLAFNHCFLPQTIYPARLPPRLNALKFNPPLLQGLGPFWCQE